MRLFSFTFFIVFTLAISALAQTPLTNRSFENGMRAAQIGEFEAAIKIYRKAILFSEAEKANDDSLAKIHFNIGVCLFNLKQTNEAVAEFTEAIKLSKRTYQKAFYALGMAHSDLKNWRKAEIAFREAVSLKKADGEAWFDLGLVLLKEEDFDAAAKAFHNAVKYESIAASDAHNNLGVIFALKNDFLIAESEFKTALSESKGKSIEARNNLQFCKLYKRNFNQNLLAEFAFSRRNKKGE